MRPIDAYALWNKAEEMYIHTKSGKIIPVMAVPTWAINNAPTIEVEPVRHGKWEAYPSDGYMRCSNCRVEYLKMKILWSYCPHCGAKMDLK